MLSFICSPAGVTVPVVPCTGSVNGKDFAARQRLERKDSKTDSSSKKEERGSGRTGRPDKKHSHLPLSPASPLYGLFDGSSGTQKELIAIRVQSSFSNSSRPLGLAVDHLGHALVGHASFKHVSLTHVSMPLRHAFTPYGYRIEPDQPLPTASAAASKLINPKAIALVEPALTASLLQRSGSLTAGDTKSSAYGATPSAGGAGFFGAPPSTAGGNGPTTPAYQPVSLRTPALALSSLAGGSFGSASSTAGLPPYAAYIVDDNQLALFAAPVGTGRPAITSVFQFSDLPVPSAPIARAVGAIRSGAAGGTGGSSKGLNGLGAGGSGASAGGAYPAAALSPAPGVGGAPSPFGARPGTAAGATLFDRVSWAKEGIGGCAVRRRPRLTSTSAGTRPGHRPTSSLDGMSGNTGSGGSSSSALGIGDVFFTCQGRCRIYCRHAASGAVTAFAGTGESGYRDGSALGARFEAPAALCFDSTEKRLFVADKTRVRVINMEDSTCGLRCSSLCVLCA